MIKELEKIKSSVKEKMWFFLKPLQNKEFLELLCEKTGQDLEIETWSKKVVLAEFYLMELELKNK